MEFEKAMRLAANYLTFEERFISPDQPQGIWICDSPEEVFAIQINAVCLGTGVEWDDLEKCQPFFECFDYVVIVTPNPIARKALVKEIPPRLPVCCIYEISDASFRGKKTIQEYIDAYGHKQLWNLLSGAEELPAYGLVDLSTVEPWDLTKIPRILSGFDRLDKSIAGFFAGELSVWTGKRGRGKSTILSQMLLQAINQGHTVCAYSGELDKEQFREWAYLQAAGPDHVEYRRDPLTGKDIPTVNPQAAALISDWLRERFWLFDLERNTTHDPKAILSQFQYAKMRYGADVFLVDNIMAVDFTGVRERDFYREQSKFTQELAMFAKRHRAHVHMVAHPRKEAGSGKSVSNDKFSADDVGGSGDITNAADNVFFITTHMVGEDRKPILVTLKNRNFGSKVQPWLDFDKKSRRFFSFGGDPKKPFGWEMAAKQLEIKELPGENKDMPF